MSILPHPEVDPYAVADRLCLGRPVPPSELAAARAELGLAPDPTRDLAGYLDGEAAWYRRLGSSAAGLVAAAIADLAGEVRFFMTGGRPIDAETFLSRRDAHVDSRYLAWQSGDGPVGDPSADDIPWYDFVPPLPEELDEEDSGGLELAPPSDEDSEWWAEETRGDA